MVAPTGKVALIPGGIKGIGRAIAVRLAEQGWGVALCYRASEDAAAEARADLERRGARVLVTQADVSTVDGCAGFFAQARDWSASIDARIAALIHAAGPYHRVDLMDETPDGWRAMFAANLDGFFYLSRLAAPEMIAHGWGRILAFSIANAAQVAAQPNLTAHYLAKVGVLGLVRAWAKRLAPDGITVNAISPGFIDSGSMDEAELRAITKNIPIGRVGTLHDAVSAAMFLLSDEAAYITGVSLPVSGGWGL